MIPPCIIDIARRIGGSCVEPIVGHIKTEVGYLWSYNANIEKLRKEIENLNDATKSMNHRIAEARVKGKTQIDAVVDRWQQRVNSLVEKASKIIQDKERETERCLMGLRPNLWACYLASKSAQKLIDTLLLRKQNLTGRSVAGVDYFLFFSIF